MEKDYYQILGITDDEKKLHGKEFNEILNKKYKKLALKYHPDRHVNDSEEEKKAAEEKFKEITEANTVLSDEKARNQYDNGGMGGMDFTDFMSHFGGFGGFNPFGDFFGGGFGQQQRQQVGSDVQQDVTITFDESYHGGYKNIKIQKQVQCASCNGTGSADGKVHTCPECNGSGIKMIRQQRGNVTMMTNSPCQKCHGTGKIASVPCNKCNGVGLTSKFVDKQIEIPKGVATGMAIRLEREGNEPAGGGINGDLIVRFNVTPDSYFERNDSFGISNVVHIEEVPFNEAILGFNKEVKTPNGGKAYLHVPECTPDGKFFMFNGQGFPDVRNNTHYGDYAVQIKYKYPNKLTDKQKEILKTFNE